MCEHTVVNDLYRAIAVPVLRSNTRCDRPLWDVDLSTMETPREWRSAIGTKECPGFDSPCPHPGQRPFRFVGMGLCHVRTSENWPSGFTTGHPLETPCRGAEGLVR